MATSTGPNTKTRKAKAAKAGKCQLCGAKTDPGYSVIVDPPGVGEVKKVKAREGKSFWCNDCAKSKVASYEKAIERKKSNGGSAAKKTAAKPKAKAAAKTAAKPAAKKATARKPAKKVARKPRAKAVAASDVEPF